LANRPGKFENVNKFKSHEVKFRDQLRNCEDVLFEEGMGIAFLSCNPERDQWNTVMVCSFPLFIFKTKLSLGVGDSHLQGTFATALDKRDGEDRPNIWIYDYSTPSIPDSDALKPLVLTNYDNAADFQPLGIEFDAVTSTLYVINHSRNSGNIIEVFQVSVQDAVARHMQTLKHPLIYTPNSIHSLGDGKLLVTNDHYIGALISPLISQVETFAGIPGGSVVYTDIQNPSHTKTLVRIPFANGIAMLNSSTVAVASSAKMGVNLYTFSPDTINLYFRKYIRAPSSVDNLSVDASGKLLMAGHPFAASLMKVSKARAKCNMRGSEEEKKACECTAASFVAEWSESGGLNTLYKNSGEEFCSSSTYARDVGRGVGIVTGLYDRGILVARDDPITVE
jgi:arylesterase/paraoxonase